MQDLGQKIPSHGIATSPAEEESKISYPTLYITSDERIALPEGEFTFTAKGRVVERAENERDEDAPRYRYEIEVKAMEPVDSPESDDDDDMERPDEKLEREWNSKGKS